MKRFWIRVLHYLHDVDWVMNPLRFILFYMALSLVARAAVAQSILTAGWTTEGSELESL
jgi:hypothetical protein